MKNLLTFVLYIISLNAVSQTPILDISEDNGEYEINGVYYKDTQYLLNNYEGTYIYNQGGIMLKLVLQKKELSFYYNKYEDLIIGEYQYIENGIEKINTLNRLNTIFTNGSFYSIHGNRIMSAESLCHDCLPNETHLVAGLVETATDNLAAVDIKLITINGQPAIRFNLYWRYRTRYSDNQIMLQPSFPGGDYIMLKQ